MIEIRKSWFGEDPPKNFKPARVEIGAGDNGKVNIKLNALTDTTGYSVVLVKAATENKPLSVALAAKKLTITLGTKAGGDIDDTLNTAELVAEAINDANLGFTAKHSGTGETAMIEAPSKNFTAMQLGTVSPEPFVVLAFFNMIADDFDYYTTLAPNGIHDANWRKFILEDF